MSYKVAGMLWGSGLNKDTNSGIHVPYKSEKDRREYAVTVLPSSGQLRWRGGAVHTLGQVFLYVMDGDGNIYTAPEIEVQHHSAFLAGQPAAAAGRWGADRGFLIWIDADSGHYQLPSDYSEQLLTELKKRGARID